MILMKVANLSASVIEELGASEYWRIDIDPGFDAKHEFFMRWEYLLPNPVSLSCDHRTGQR